jgi:hypothetical protein
MANIRFLVLDVLKLHNPPIVEFGADLMASQRGISINITVQGVDERTETVKLVVQGESIDYQKIAESIESQGASIHSVDEVCMGAELICSRR